jgi:hypothetical protein
MPRRFRLKPESTHEEVERLTRAYLDMAGRFDSVHRNGGATRARRSGANANSAKRKQPAFRHFLMNEMLAAAIPIT